MSNDSVKTPQCLDGLCDPQRGILGSAFGSFGLGPVWRPVEPVSGYDEMSFDAHIGLSWPSAIPADKRFASACNFLASPVITYK